MPDEISTKRIVSAADVKKLQEMQQRVIEEIEFLAGHYKRPWRHPLWWTAEEMRASAMFARTAVPFHADVEQLVCKLYGIEMLTGKPVKAAARGQEVIHL